ncbi:LuxR C-terminal-related transcriptional regulator [Streptomyces sp. 1222.5]|uniref:LuxR C-terminal-related transcriptional regulator n=1 Tax=Streptomyces sp. 1222.5 TaxID=1881026 RepID=UPI003EB6C61E
MNIQNAAAQGLGMRWPMAGRSEELAAVKRAWLDRRCRAVVVYGPAGVGKTRLAEEGLAQVVQCGWKARRATATMAAAAVPLGALAHLIPAGVDLSDPVRGYAQVTRVLAGPERNRRWAVLVDDLHLLDAASAVLLHQLLDAGVVRLIGTVRTGEPVREAVQGLTDGDAVHRIDLGPFASEQLEQVLRAALGGPVGRHTLHTLSTASGGNALYVRELVLGAVAAGTLTNDGEIWELAGGLPATPLLAELIGTRVAAAGPAAREVLELLALCERVPVTDAENVAPLRVLDGLKAAGLVHVVTDRRRTALALAHPLYGEFLRAELPALRRRKLLLDQADRVRAHGARRRDDALHLATWQLAATGTADPQMLLQAATLARHAHDYQRVDALLQAVPEEEQTFTSCLLHGDALSHLGQWEQSDKLLARAESAASSQPETLMATLARTWTLFWAGAQTSRALEVNETARTRSADTTARHVLTLNEAKLRVLSGQLSRGLALLSNLEDEPAKAFDPNMWVMASMAKTAGLSAVGRLNEAASWAHHSYTAQSRIDEHLVVTGAPAAQLNPLIFTLSDSGQLAEARTIADQVLGETLTGDRPTGVWAMLFRARNEWLAGDIAATRRWSAETLARARIHQVPRPIFHALAYLAAAAAVLGDLDSSDKALAEMQEHPPMGHLVGEDGLAQAWLHAARGHLLQARGVLDQAVAAAREGGHVTSQVLLLTDIARLGGASAVADRLAELAQVCDGAFASARAHLAAALAEDEPGQLMAAAGELKAIGAYLLAAEAATAAATAWQRTGHTRLATVALSQAHASAAHCPGARTPLLAAAPVTAPLTRREREVALLAAAGTASKEIATTLHLSVRTVDNHLQRTYAKLGVATRRELAEALGTIANRSQ